LSVSLAHPEVWSDSVFWDQKDIDPGRNFVDVIESSVASSSALLAVIGKGWGEASDDTGQRKLDSPDDLLRREIAAALRGGILVLPILGSGARMPDSSDLPDELAPLSKIQALKMTDMRFHTLLEESLAQLGIGQSAATSEEFIAARVANRAGNLLKRQAGRLQVRAKELIREGKRDRAVEELNEGVELMMALLDLAGVDEMVDLQLGYMFGAFGRQFLDAGSPDQAKDTWLYH
jgi:hypothetical protein